MTEVYANDTDFPAPITLTAAVDAAAASFPVSAVAPTGLQAGQWRAEIYDLDGEGLPRNRELVLVTASAASPFAVTRGVEGSTAVAHPVGSRVQHVLTVASFLAPTMGEADARVAADSVLATAVALKQDASTAATDSELAAESATRATADTAEATARASADTAEATTRATADSGLNTRLVTVESSGGALTPTALKTGAYTAQPGDLVLVDTTGGAVTITAPVATAGAKPWGVKHVIQGATNVVTITRQGSDVFNKPGGSTTQTLQLINQAMRFEQEAGVHVVSAGDVALSVLDARYNVLPGVAGFQAVVNPYAAPYNVKGDYKQVADGAMTNGSAILTCATSTPFTSTAVDAGKKIVVMGAGVAGAALSTTIATVTDSGHAVLSASASTTVSAKAVQFATDDTAGINAAITAANAIAAGDPLFAAAGGIVPLLNRGHLITSPLLHKSNVTLDGMGSGSTAIHQQFANAFSMWTCATALENTWRVRGIRFDGHGAQQTATADAFVISRSFAGNLITPPYTPAFFDPTPWYVAFADIAGGDQVGVEDISIWHINGNGLVGTQYALHVDRVFILDVSLHGINFAGADCNFTNLQVGFCGHSCIVDGGANNRYTTVKAYQSAEASASSGFPCIDLQGNKLIFESIEIQQCRGPGVRFGGTGANRFTGRIDGCVGDAIAFQNSGTRDNYCEVTVTNFVGLVPAYYVGFAGTNNEVHIKGNAAPSSGLIHGAINSNLLRMNGGHDGLAFSKIEAAGSVNAAGTGLSSGAQSLANVLARMLPHAPTVTNIAETTGTDTTGAGYSVTTSGGANNGSVVTDVLTQVTRPTGAAAPPFMAGSGLVILDGCRYDLTQRPQTAQTLTAIKHGLRAVIARYLAAFVMEDGDAALTFTGSWAASASDPGYSGGTTKAAGANGDTVTHTVPAGWRGGYVTLGVKGVAGGNGAIFTITGTGVTTTALDSRSLANTGTTCVATARVFVPASAAGTTLTVTVSSFTGAAAFDYISYEVSTGFGGTTAIQWSTAAPGALYDAASPPLILVLGDPKLVTYPSPYSDTQRVNNCVPTAMAVVQEFASTRVIFVDTSGALITYQGVADATIFQSNGSFLNQLGHAKLAGSLIQYINAAGLSSQDYASLA